MAVAEKIEKALKKYKNKILIIGVVLVALDGLLFVEIVRGNTTSDNLALYFLDVGQGDSELVMFPGGVKMLIDGGPETRRAAEELSRIFPSGDRYIDMVMISHSQLDHFGGLIEVLKRYRVGVFLWNGVEGKIAAFHDLKNILEKNNTRVVALGQHDRIHYGENKMDILWPPRDALDDKELNNTSIVAELTSKNIKALFTGDIESKTEQKLVYQGLTSIDILKIPHHGSKTSTSENFLAALQPKIVGIGVGKNNYGHPTRVVLDRLQKYGVRTYRTDKNGTIKLLIDGKSIKVFQQL